MKYERITDKEHRYKKCAGCTYKKCQYCDDKPDYEREGYNRLAELEDKIEQGTLIELPCKVGDTVYEVFKDHIPPFIKETKIEKIVITAKGLRLRLARNSFYETAVSSIGKTIFFTREEAEKRLKEWQE